MPSRYGEVALSRAVVLRLVETEAECKVLREWRFAYKIDQLRVDCEQNTWSLPSDDEGVLLIGGSFGKLQKTVAMPKGLQLRAIQLLDRAWQAPEWVRIRQLLAKEGTERAAAVAEQVRDACKKRARQAQEELEAAEQAVERCTKRMHVAAPAALAAAS